MRSQFAKELLDISNQEFGHFHSRELLANTVYAE
jgi:hypothetical protein